MTSDGYWDQYKPGKVTEYVMPKATIAVCGVLTTSNVGRSSRWTCRWDLVQAVVNHIVLEQKPVSIQSTAPAEPELSQTVTMSDPSELVQSS